MGFKLIEIVGWRKFRNIEQNCINDGFESLKEKFDGLGLILISSVRSNGYRILVYHVPFCGDVRVIARNSLDAMTSLDGAVNYIKERQRELGYF